MPEFLVSGEMLARIHKVVEARTAEAAKRKAMRDSEHDEAWWFDDIQPIDSNISITGVSEFPSATKESNGCQI